MAQKNSTPFFRCTVCRLHFFRLLFCTLALCDQSRRECDQRGRECDHEGKTCEQRGKITKEGLVNTREGQVATEEGAFLACLTCPYVFCVPFHDLAAPLELAPGWRDSAFPAPCGGVPPPHRPARQRGFSAAKNPVVFITED